MFFENEQDKLQFAVYTQLTFVQANSEAVLKGFATPGAIVTLPVLLATKIGQTSRGNVDLTANLGINLSTKADTANYISGSVGIGTALTPHVALMGALITEQAIATVGDQSRAQLIRADLGVMATISRQFLVFGALGHSLVASDTQDHTYAVAGIRLLAGGPSPQVEKVALK